VRVLDAEAVEWRIEEEGGSEHPADGGDNRRHDAPARSRNHHRNQIDHGAVAEPGLDDDEIDRRGDGRDHAKRQQNAAQFFADAVEFQGVEHAHAVRRPGLPGRAQYTPPELGLSLVSPGPLGQIAAVQIGLFPALFGPTERWQSG